MKQREVVKLQIAQISADGAWINFDRENDDENVSAQWQDWAYTLVIQIEKKDVILVTDALKHS